MTKYTKRHTEVIDPVTHVTQKWGEYSEVGILHLFYYFAVFFEILHDDTRHLSAQLLNLQWL